MTKKEFIKEAQKVNGVWFSSSSVCTYSKETQKDLDAGEPHPVLVQINVDMVLCLYHIVDGLPVERLYLPADYTIATTPWGIEIVLLGMPFWFDSYIEEEYGIPERYLEFFFGTKNELDWGIGKKSQAMIWRFWEDEINPPAKRKPLDLPQARLIYTCGENRAEELGKEDFGPSVIVDALNAGEKVWVQAIDLSRQLNEQSEPLEAYLLWKGNDSLWIFSGQGGVRDFPWLRIYSMKDITFVKGLREDAPGEIVPQMYINGDPLFDNEDTGRNTDEYIEGILSEWSISVEQYANTYYDADNPRLEIITPDFVCL